MSPRLVIVGARVLFVDSIVPILSDVAIAFLNVSGFWMAIISRG